MHVNTGVFGQPLLYDRVLVRSIVIGDQMQFLIFRRLPVNFFQELQPFSVGMALLALPDDLTIQYVECSE